MQPELPGTGPSGQLVSLNLSGGDQHACQHTTDWLACHAFGAKKKSASYVIVITQLFGAGIYLVKVSVSVARP